MADAYSSFILSKTCALFVVDSSRATAGHVLRHILRIPNGAKLVCLALQTSKGDRHAFSELRLVYLQAGLTGRVASNCTETVRSVVVARLSLDGGVTEPRSQRLKRLLRKQRGPVNNK